MYCPSGSVNPENFDGNIVPWDWKSLVGQTNYLITVLPNIWGSRYRQNAILMRDALKVYVNIGEVKVAWQLDYERTT